MLFGIVFSHVMFPCVHELKPDFPLTFHWMPAGGVGDDGFGPRQSSGAGDVASDAGQVSRRCRRRRPPDRLTVRRQPTHGRPIHQEGRRRLQETRWFAWKPTIHLFFTTLFTTLHALRF